MPNTKAPKRRSKKEANKKVSENRGISTPSSNPEIIPSELQQWVLDIFQVGCQGVFDDSLNSTIQEIKKHLFERDFINAFSKPEYLQAYAARWSPTRALCYFEILSSLNAITDRLFKSLQGLHVDDSLIEVSEKLHIDDPDFFSPNAPQSQTGGANAKASLKKQTIVFLGAGGGAELAAFAGFLRKQYFCIPPNSPAKPSLTAPRDLPPQDRLDSPFDCVFVDVADWSEVLSRLYSSASTIGPSNRHDSPLNQGVGTHVTPLQFSMSVRQQDVLKATQDDLATIVSDASIVTLMFTLNELYSTSLGSATKMLLHLTSVIEPGAFLLVVDSPGSYSTVNIGQPSHLESDSTVPNDAKPIEKRYPMQWLLDHTLLETATTIDSEKCAHKQWTKLVSEESKWFRLPRLQKLQYPLELEDMRYQVHLYQRT